MSVKKIAAIVCALSMTTAMLASCGDKDESSSSSSKADTASSAAAAESTAESAAESEAGSAAESAAESTAADSSADDEYPGVVTEFKGHDAMLMFADSEWFWRNMNMANDADAETPSYGVDADVTGDGEYTVSINKNTILGTDDAPNEGALINEDTGELFASNGVSVFCVDIMGIVDGTTNYKGEAIKKNKLKEGDPLTKKDAPGAYTGQEITCEVTSITADGKEVEFDPSKIVYGNIEDNNNCYRIEIYNSYGDTVKDPPIDPMALSFEKELSVTFKISGLDKEAAAE